MDATPMTRTLRLSALAALLLIAGCAQRTESATAAEPPTAAEPANGEVVDAHTEVEPRAAEPMKLAAAPQAAVAQLQAASKKGPVLVFKHSPICPVSAAAHEQFQTWMGEEEASEVQHAHIDVLAEKPLARGIVAELDIRHESPQVLLFHDGEVVWHASHGAITGESLSEQLMLLEE